MKVARMVLTGGKSVKIYLSGLGRGMYYASFKTPRTLVWVIGTVILIMMIVIGFLGYLNSPKWFNINIFILSVYINYDTIYYIINILNYKDNTLLLSNKNYNKFNNMYFAPQRSSFFLAASSEASEATKKKAYMYVLKKILYSTTNNNTGINISDRLDSIIKESGLNNPVYIF